MGDGNHGMWGRLPLLVRANSKDSVEYILQALWRTRRTGLDAADRQIFQDILQLSDDADLDPLLVCLRILIRRCVYEHVGKDEIRKLFPAEVLPELQRLLTLLLQKFQKEWREDMSKDRLQSDAQTNLGERNIKVQLEKNSMEMMLKSMFCIRDQLSDLSLPCHGETLDKNMA